MTPEVIQRGNTRDRNSHDVRIQAFVAMAPALGQGFQRSAQVAQIDKPVLIIGAICDERTPVTVNAGHYANFIPSATYTELDAPAAHYVFMNVAKNGLRRQAPEIFQDAPSVDRQAVHDEVVAMVSGFTEEAFRE